MKLEDIDRDEFAGKMNSESDRACAVLGAALLDAKLESLFSKRLRKFRTELLNGTGPISTFSSRIKLATALAWIDDPIQKDLDAIRGIRNDFAHSFDHELSFQNESVAARCNNLIVAQSYLDGYEDSIGAPGQNLSEHAIRAMKNVFEAPRWRFQLSVDFIAQYLDEIAETQLGYQSNDLLREVRDLSANSRVKISATGSVGSPK